MAHKFNPVNLEELTAEPLHHLIAAHSGKRALEMMTILYTMGSAATLFVVSDKEDVLYRGKSLAKAVAIYNGEDPEPELFVQEVQPQHVKLEIHARRKYKLL